MPFLDPEELKPKLKKIFETVVIPQIKKANMKQTAVEWFVKQLSSYTTTDGNIISHHQNITHLFEQAKEMEKEQMKESFNEALYQDVDNAELLEFEQYYNETYKSE